MVNHIMNLFVSNLSKIEQAADPKAFEIIEKFVTNIGRPIKREVEDDYIVYTFKKGVSITFFEWAGLDEKTIAADMLQVRDEVDEDFLTKYCAGTTLQPCLEQWRELTSQFAENSCLYADHSTSVFGVPQIPEKLKDRTLMVAYVCKNYSITIGKRAA